jgi:hypothetical protein
MLFFERGRDMNDGRGFVTWVTLVVLLAGCSGGGSGVGSNNGSPVASSAKSTVTISMVDSPFRFSGADVTAVTVDVKEVELIGQGGPQTISVFNPPQQINLLDFQTVPGLQLGTAAIPAGRFEQIRLLLDSSSPDNNSITVDGTTYPLKIPSATTGEGFGNGTSVDKGDGPGTSGIKVRVGLVAAAGQTYSILIDFNAAESIVEAGNSGKWIMKPVLVATAYASGFFAGIVTNSINGQPVVDAEIVAQQGGQSINGGITAADGSYEINALPLGSYSLQINNLWTNQAGMPMSATNSNGAASGTCVGPFTISTDQTSVDISENPTPSPTSAPSSAPFVCSP